MRAFLWFVEVTALVATAVSVYAQNYAAMLFYGFVAAAVPMAVHLNAKRGPQLERVTGKTRSDALRAFLVADAVCAVAALFWAGVSLRAGGAVPLGFAVLCTACLCGLLLATWVLWRRLPRDYVYGSDG